ncbi:Uncharacterised protein [Chlamydia trachomatis]|nr:Uncharacterised protein [Chlamydia trachomatis]
MEQQIQNGPYVWIIINNLQENPVKPQGNIQKTKMLRKIRMLVTVEKEIFRKSKGCYFMN